VVSKAKLERLLNLTALLIETPRPLTATEVRERMEGYPDEGAAFRQAFERDKRDLREMGIPLSVETVPGTMPAVDGYRIPKDRYYLADPGLTPDELAALHLAAEVVRLEGGAADEGLAKLGAAGGPDTGPAPIGDDLAALPGRHDLGALFGAVIDRRPVRFAYRDQARTVDPWRLDFQRGRWYLTGFDHTRDDERVYRLDRIAGEVEVLDGPTFDRPATAGPGGPAEPWQLGEGEPVMARVAVDAVQAPWIVDHLGMEAVVDRPADGSVVVELPVTNRESFRSFVLTFLDHAEVLEPVELRDDMVRWLEELAR
jgi:predicted DNA-binding transcriptional regulator YafY